MLLALDAQNGVRGYKVAATGGQSSTTVDAKTLFRDALLLGAAATRTRVPRADTLRFTAFGPTR